MQIIGTAKILFEGKDLKTFPVFVKLYYNSDKIHDK